VTHLKVVVALLSNAFVVDSDSSSINWQDLWNWPIKSHFDHILANMNGHLKASLSSSSDESGSYAIFSSAKLLTSSPYFKSHLLEISLST
jgi:hypothetical protein